jgi:hypothetical protein
VAGSYSHAVTEEGKLRSDFDLLDMMDTTGDLVECITEMYGMIWWLAEYAGKHLKVSPELMVEQAHGNYHIGLARSPGIEPED